MQPRTPRLRVQALSLHSAAANALTHKKYEELVTMLPPEMALLRTYPHTNAPVSVPEGAGEVHISHDVHGDKVKCGIGG